MSLQSTVYFFEREIVKHTLVVQCVPLIRDAKEVKYIYTIHRKNGAPVKVYISDAYQYDVGDYLSRPRELGPGDFIFANEFGRAISPDAVECARADRIGLGTFGKLKGALNCINVWEYRSPAEKAAQSQKKAPS